MAITKVKLTKSQLTIDAETLSMTEMTAKYDLSAAQIKKALKQIGVEKKKVQPAKFEIEDDVIEETNAPQMEMSAEPVADLPEDPFNDLPELEEVGASQF